MAGTVTVDTIKSEVSTPTVFNNSSGVEIGRLCRHWVNIIGTTGASRASFNTSSTTRTGVGLYSVSITTAITDANYVTMMSAHLCDGTNDTNFGIVNYPRSTTTPTTTTSYTLAVAYRTQGIGGWYDTLHVLAAINR